MRISTFLIGLSLILVGLTLFLTELGYTSWKLFRQVAEYWPVLLILIGIKLIWKERMPRWVDYLMIVSTSCCGLNLLLFEGPTVCQNYLRLNI